MNHSRAPSVNRATGILKPVQTVSDPADHAPTLTVVTQHGATGIHSGPLVDQYNTKLGMLVIVLVRLDICCSLSPNSLTRDNPQLSLDRGLRQQTT